MYRVHLAVGGIKLTTLVVTGTDFIGYLISNYHIDLSHDNVL